MKISNVNMNTNPQQVSQQKEEADAAAFEKAIEKAVASGDEEQLKKVAKQFESVFMHMMLKSMRSTVQDGGLTEKSHARGIFESMYDQTIADEMAEGGTMGIADMIYNQLSKHVDDGDEEDQGNNDIKKVSIDSKG